ncbi:LPXTG cell wall anchor domain-containing protein [Ligilactobacillus saerimneri]|uniref:LPXTG cell wall anchor domain-containing protein n=1 Tax=Ligilactobacillus saerimneri TaxID=228229 RepID=A0A7H9EN07_9LACO|nr:LPXTG cell wall anchor domain-containing protein [Ligilactobacillus saerimneri]QLL78692.1 LPXTG cell wall anchor domain-containing protein [Ligilactobacillus saerimneri]
MLHYIRLKLKHQLSQRLIKLLLLPGFYNNPQITASDWLKMVHGEAIAYYTAKGKDGKTYVTGYVAADGKSQSIINVEQIDLNTLEYHLIYHNGDKEVGSGLWANFADGKTIAIDTSRLGADGLQLKSQQGWSYSYGINGVGDNGNYYNSWADYVKAHNGSGANATQISLTGTAIKPDDTIEIVIPIKYIGQLSDQAYALPFASIIGNYGNGFTRNRADLYFTKVYKDLTQIKQIILRPGVFVSEKPGESIWIYAKELQQYMPDGRDVLKISNFLTYKGAFNLDSLPTGELPDVIYGSAQYFIDLQEIQKIFAQHGYTVKFANNNGQAQQMPFYAYTALPSAKFPHETTSYDPTVLEIQVQAVPALILNKDQYYRADPNAGAWDTTSMIDAIYGADDPGARKSREELDQLPKTDVNISYEYQAPGATVTRDLILDATTGEVKSTAKWETYSAPDFKGYTPDVAQVEETTVTKDTQDTTVEINYTANKPTTPDQNNDQGQKPQTEKQVTEKGQGTAMANTQGQTPAPAAQSAQAQKLPHTGEAENRLGILGVLTATLGMLGLGWKKREKE